MLSGHNLRGEAWPEWCRNHADWRPPTSRLGASHSLAVQVWTVGVGAMLALGGLGVGLFVWRCAVQAGTWRFERAAHTRFARQSLVFDVQFSRRVLRLAPEVEGALPAFIARKPARTVRGIRVC